MAEPSKILEGVFAISKPPSLSSAQVIRDLQEHFKASKLFAPLLVESDRRNADSDRQRKRRRRDADSVFKMGHGGTLDPMATGVLIIGLGRGTKHLQNFLGCTKQYDTVVLFGKSTDTYDVCGKIVGDAPFSQITREKVESKLAQFRGHIKQVPPVYSALKIDGMKAYDYARSGKPLPRELESRDMQVDECIINDYYEGGNHDFRWPAEEAPEDEKAAVKELMQGNKQTSNGGESQQTHAKASTSEVHEEPPAAPEGSESMAESQPSSASALKILDANTSIDAVEGETMATSPSSNTRTHDIQEAVIPTTNTAEEQTTRRDSPDPKSNSLEPALKASLHTHDIGNLSSTPSPAPAARVSLTVSSGFYVRSFAHDLGLALSSQGIMAELTRSRQGDFVIPQLSSKYPDLSPAITYADLEAGEEMWGPKLQAVLEKWLLQNPLPGERDQDGNIRPDDRDADRSRYGRNRNQSWRGRGGGWKGRGRGGGRGSSNNNNNNNNNRRAGMKRDRE